MVCLWLSEGGIKKCFMWLLVEPQNCKTFTTYHSWDDVAITCCNPHALHLAWKRAHTLTHTQTHTHSHSHTHMCLWLERRGCLCVALKFSKSWFEVVEAAVAVAAVVAACFFNTRWRSLDSRKYFSSKDFWEFVRQNCNQHKLRKSNVYNNINISSLRMQT